MKTALFLHCSSACLRFGSVFGHLSPQAQNDLQVLASQPEKAQILSSTQFSLGGSNTFLQATFDQAHGLPHGISHTQPRTQVVGSLQVDANQSLTQPVGFFDIATKNLVALRFRLITWDNQERPIASASPILFGQEVQDWTQLQLEEMEEFNDLQIFSEKQSELLESSPFETRVVGFATTQNKQNRINSIQFIYSSTNEQVCREALQVMSGYQAQEDILGRSGARLWISLSIALLLVLAVACASWFFAPIYFLYFIFSHRTVRLSSQDHSYENKLQQVKRRAKSLQKQVDQCVPREEFDAILKELVRSSFVQFPEHADLSVGSESEMPEFQYTDKLSEQDSSEEEPSQTCETLITNWQPEPVPAAKGLAAPNEQMKSWNCKRFWLEAAMCIF